MNRVQDSGRVKPAAVFFGGVARRILAQHADEIPDLRRAVVLLPNYHAARPLAQALTHASQRPVLLLPQMVTLNDWAQSIPLAAPIIPDSQRSALLFQHLYRQKWFGQADLWSMAQELLTLFDELTHALHVLPADAEAFTAAVQQAWQARQNETLQLEARLVFELWHAMQSGAGLDAARAYQQRLAQLAEQADKPLYVLRTSDWDVLEQRFLDEYGRRAPVEVFDLREMAVLFPAPLCPSGYSPDGGGEGNSLSPREKVRVRERLRFFAATSLEQEARAAAMQVRRWLNEGKRDVAVVAQDRVVARRMRALLERAEVLVADETGWTFSTLSVSTVLDRWLTALQSDFYHHDLLDLLKSPFIFADMKAGERKAVVYQLEKLLRKRGVVSGLAKFGALAEHEHALRQPLARLRQAAALLEQNRRRTLGEWLSALHESLDVLGIVAGLRQDDAGIQLLHVLSTWQRELAEDGGRYAFKEWRRWLAQQLDMQTYRDSSIDSSVSFTHLAATRWRAFDAVLLLGCDAGHLPSIADGGRWFNDAVRAALNLPTRAARAARQHDDLLGLLTLNDCVLATWQKEKNGEQGLLSPYLQMLRDACELQHGDDLGENELHACLAAEDVHAAGLPQSAQPAPTAPAEMVPHGISISAYNSLVACPYQFHARHILRLNELDEVQEAIEKRDYGERVHDILQRFHDRYPRVGAHRRDEMETVLRRISEEVFADLLERDYTARAWLVRWYRSLPAYLEWQVQNEAEGWRHAESEREFELQLEGVRLRGRIDRMDEREGEKRVLDYKTQGDQALRNKLKEPGEDVQLACYAHAEAAGAAVFISIEDGKVRAIAPPHDITQLARLNAERLEQVMEHIRDGAGMPANGIDQACMHCEMRGVCRKGEWTA
ncbi:MAG: PD-(D/E)XK nuclease family protein [Pseudomonadota bacterium]